MKIEKLIKNDIVKVQFPERHYYWKIIDNDGEKIRGIECDYLSGRATMPFSKKQTVTYMECENANMEKIGKFIPLIDRILSFSFEPIKYVK